MTTQVRESEDIDLVHELKRIVKHDERQCPIAGTQRKGDEVREGHNIKLTLATHNLWVISDVYKWVIDEWQRSALAVVDVMFEAQLGECWVCGQSVVNRAEEWVKFSEPLCRDVYDRSRGSFREGVENQLDGSDVLDLSLKVPFLGRCFLEPR